MAAAPVTSPLPTIHHEHWCQPTGGRDAIRVEQYLAYTDDEKTGRSLPSKRVTRCQECGEARYEDL